MRRAEAESLKGERVFVWTAMNGQYVGTLESVEGSPWRGTVLITGVIEPACVFDMTRMRPRRGFRPGERITAGGVNIKPTDLVGMSYLDALRAQLEKFSGWLENGDSYRPRYTAWLPSAIRALARAIEQESGSPHVAGEI